MRIATSLISVEQAKRNLAQEIAPTDTFETVRDRAQNAWDDKLKVVEVEGATEDQQTTLYSNLYRLFLYPNSAHENVADSGQAPNWRHAVQSSTSTPPSMPTETGAPVVDGKVYVNNGFWDTYRTAWSAYALFSPGSAGELVDGFVQQYRDGGWVSRWSSPGYANLMTGTSSDVSFADAYVKGVKGFNARDAYDAAVRNATVAPPGSDPNNPSVGRKGLVTSTFLGFTPSAVSEGVSWALEGYINDFGISNMAKALAADPATSAADRKRYLEEHEYFSERARNYVNMFDPSIEFFQGRSRERALEVLAGGLRPARLGPRARLHGDRRLELRVPRAARRQRPGQPLRRPRRPREEAGQVLQHARDRQVHRLLRRDHPRDGRGPGRPDGPVGLQQPGVAPHPVDVRLREAAVQDRGEGARGPAPHVHRLGDRAGVRRRRGQRRDVGLVPVRGDGALPAPGGQPQLRDRLAAVQEGDDPPPGRQGHRRQRAEQQRSQHLRAGPDGQRAAARQDVAEPLADRQRRDAHVRHGPAAVRLGDQGEHVAAFADGGRRPGAAAARRDRRAARHGIRHGRRATPRRCSTTRRSRGPR